MDMAAAIGIELYDGKNNISRATEAGRVRHEDVELDCNTADIRKLGRRLYCDSPLWPAIFVGHTVRKSYYGGRGSVAR